MIFGSDGIVGIYFSDYELTKEISSIALVIIMFYGGFGTNWSMAATPPIYTYVNFRVIITSNLLDYFTYCTKNYIIRRITYRCSSIYRCSISICILRSQKLNLKGSLAPLLEVESGSNDPVAYMATLSILLLMDNKGILTLFYGNKTNCI